VVNLHSRVEWFEKSLIQQALVQSEGSVGSAVEFLGTPRKTLYDKMKKYGIDKNLYKL
jgi:two-component system C4-dicarboxylate transport response regulator DctD